HLVRRSVHPAAKSVHPLTSLAQWLTVASPLQKDFHLFQELALPRAWLINSLFSTHPLILHHAPCRLQEVDCHGSFHRKSDWTEEQHLHVPRCFLHEFDHRIPYS